MVKAISERYEIGREKAQKALSAAVQQKCILKKKYEKNKKVNIYRLPSTGG
jgi:ATP-dependent protease Clp ATPase subunit